MATIEIPDDLFQDADALYKARGITLSEVVSLYLRSCVNNADAGRSLTLDMKMPFGKYRGEMVGTIVRADPGYMRFMLGADRPIQVGADVLALLK